MFILRPCLQFNSGNWSSMRSFLYFYLNRRCCKLGADWKSQGPDWRWRRQDLTDCQFQEFKFQFITKSGYSKSRYDSIFHPHHSTPVSRKYGMIMQYLNIFFFYKTRIGESMGWQKQYESLLQQCWCFAFFLSLLDEILYSRNLQYE